MDRSWWAEAVIPNVVEGGSHHPGYTVGRHCQRCCLSEWKNASNKHGGISDVKRPHPRAGMKYHWLSMSLADTLSDRQDRKRGDTDVVAGREYRPVNRIPTDASRRSMTAPRGNTGVAFGVSLSWPRRRNDLGQISRSANATEHTLEVSTSSSMQTDGQEQNVRAR